MGKKPALLLFFAALVLAACGGGGGGGGTMPPGGGPTPTPARTATPTPTPSPTPTPTPIPGNGNGLSGAATDPNGDWGPPAVARALDFPVQHAYDGTGQTIAVVIDSDVKRADLTQFFQFFQIPTTARTITTVAVSPLPAPTVKPGGAQDEATLDVETTAALAPGANIRIYQVADLSDASLINAYDKIQAEKKAFIVNNSIGGCEDASTETDGSDAIINQLTSNGVAYFAAAGDSGNVCDNTIKTLPVGASWPASLTGAIGVGGTETDPANGFTLTSKQVWNDHWCGPQCAGGGGVSKLYAIPSYQQGLAGTASQTKRNTPDISFPAVDTGIIENAKWLAIGGTSWSTPEASALFAELYQYCGANGSAIAGVANPVTISYYVYGKASADLLDVTKGSDQYGGTTPFYVAAAGYDDASGLGVPLGWSFVQTACPNHSPASGLLARSPMSFMRATEVHSGAYTVDVTPRSADMSDEGVRGAAEPTAIQIVLQSAGNASPVTTALQQAGFTVSQLATNSLVLNAVAPSSTIEGFFRTRLHNVWQGSYGTRYLPTTQIVVPASIAPYVAGVNLANVVTHRRLLR